MSNTLTEIAEQLKARQNKVQLIYAFNGTGKTRLSREFKEIIAPKEDGQDDLDGAEQAPLSRHKILYYNAFTEDLFYWDNDLDADAEPKLKIQPNTFTDWILKEVKDQGQDQNIIENFQRYTNDKLMPQFNPEYKDGENVVPAFSEISFSFKRGDDDNSPPLKISKGEESNFIWSIFYTLINQVIDVLAVPELDNRETDQFNQLEYIYIDDPVSSLDENHLIELAVDLTQLIKRTPEHTVKFIVSTHSPQVISSVKPESLRVIDWQDDKPALQTVDFSEGAEAQHVLLEVLGLKSARVEALPIVTSLERYQSLVAQDKWDCDEAKRLREQLARWGLEHEPELARLDMDIRIKEWEREQS